MINVAIANAFVQPSPFWHRLKAAVVHFAGGLVAQPPFAAGSRDLDDRVLRDLDITPDMRGHVERRAAAPRPATLCPGRPVCRWRMDGSGAGLTMDWVDPQGGVGPEGAARTQPRPARASFG